MLLQHIKSKLRLCLISDLHLAYRQKENYHLRLKKSLYYRHIDALLKEILFHKPDLLINLGDLIDGSTRSQDMHSYRKAIQTILAYNLPFINLIGNHDLTSLTIEDISTLLLECGVKQKEYGSFMIGNIQLVWLCPKKNNDELFQIPDIQHAFLSTKLNSKFKTIILSHFPLSKFNVQGNFYVESGCPLQQSIVDTQITKELLEHENTRIVISGHLHMSAIIDDVNRVYFSAPSASEQLNLKEKHFPTIYTLVDIDFKNHSLCFKCFSGKYAFWGFEKKLNLK